MLNLNLQKTKWNGAENPIRITISIKLPQYHISTEVESILPGVICMYGRL